MRRRNVAEAVRSGGTLRRRRIFGGVAAALSTALVAGGLALTPATPAQADVTSGLLLRYKLDSESSGTAADSSGNDRHGWIFGAADWRGSEGLAFDGSTTYIKMPDNIMSGLTSITVAFDVWIDPAMGKPYFLYGLGNTNGTTGNGYLFTTGDEFRTAITPGGWGLEQNTKPSTSYQLNRGMWKHVTYTQTGNTGVLYENGAEKARNEAITITPGAIGNGTTLANYIGRSLFSKDKYFKGRMRDFRIYNRALAANEVMEVANHREVEWEQLQALAESNGGLGMWNIDLGAGPESVMRVPADFPEAKMCSGCLTPPQDWTSEFGLVPAEWPHPHVIWRSQFTEAEVQSIEFAIEDKVWPNGDTSTYKLASHYDGPSDRIVAKTDAPASVTDPLVAAYPGKVVFEAYTLEDPASATCASEATTARRVWIPGVAPAAGVGDARTRLQWDQLQAMRDHNCALDVFEDPEVGPVMIFPKDRADLTVQNPQGWSSEYGQTPVEWPDVAAGRSVQFTLADIEGIQDAVVRQISGSGEVTSPYKLSVRYDGMRDRVVAHTDAPASVTDPLLTTYPDKVVIEYTAEAPTMEPDPEEAG